MPFATTRDLVALQPTLLREAVFVSQVLHRGPVTIESGELVAVGGVFSESIAPGHVAIFADRPLEIVAMTSATSLTVSLMRASPDAPVIVPPDAGEGPGIIATFDPQISIIHDQLLRMLGLEPSQQTIDANAPGESAVLNPRDLALVESLGALHLIYAAAAAALSPASPLATRAADYRARFGRERWRARAIIDTDQDGRGDCTRSLNTARLYR